MSFQRTLIEYHAQAARCGFDYGTAEQPLWREFTDDRGIVVCVPTNALLP
jgi:hypothetical protein